MGDHPEARGGGPDHVAQLSVTIKERGARMATYMTLFIFPFAFLVGYILSLVFIVAGVPM